MVSEPKWRTFDTLPKLEASMGPSGLNIWIWNKETGRISDYINWDNWSTKKEQALYKEQGDMWCEIAPPPPPKL